MLKPARTGSLWRRRPSWNQRLAEIYSQVERLRYVPDRELRAAADVVRDHALEPDDGRQMQLCALATEAFRRVSGMHLYDTQMRAAWTMSVGRVADMKTGEGKTLAVGAAAIISALSGYPAHVATPNAYLAERDSELVSSAAEILGLRTGCASGSCSSVQQKIQAYRADIVYATGCDLGFDFLRDQLSRHQHSARPLGRRLLERLEPNAASRSTLMQRGQDFAIVDEIDNVLIDEAESPLILASPSVEQAEDARAVQLARQVGVRMEQELHFQISPSGSASLTSSGIEYVHRTDWQLPVKLLRRPWTEYVLQALRAQWCLQRDVHYLVHEHAVQIVEESTGRVFADRHWSDGLHQAIEAKEGLTITSERSVLAQVTRQRYYRLYDRLAGTTGTTAGCEREFRNVYRLGVERIPRRFPSLRYDAPSQIFATVEQKRQAIVKDTRRIHLCGRPVLIGTRTIADSEALADGLTEAGIDFCLLNGKQDAEEADIIGRAGESGAVTIATNMAGRGTDIKLGLGVNDLGGLHVIVSEPNQLQRADRQLVGRCARQGDQGSAQSYVAADDWLICTYAPWLQKPLEKLAAHSPGTFDIARRLQQVQRSVARRQEAIRMQLMRQDLSREFLFS